MIPTTSSVSQLTSKSTNPSSLDDDGGGAMTKNISKQYVSDYILSQPFDDGHNDDDDMPTSQNGANKKTVIPPSIQQRKRMLPTAHIRRQQQQPPQKQLSSDRDDDAASTPDSASAMDEIESVPRGKQHSPSLSPTRRRQRARRASRTPILGRTLTDDTWRKNDILAAKLENFLTTVPCAFPIRVVSLASRRGSVSRLHVSCICLVNKSRDDVLSCSSLSRSSHVPLHARFEDRDTLKDSGIDTASSSTILNLVSSDAFKRQVSTDPFMLSMSSLLLFFVVLSCTRTSSSVVHLYYFLARDNLAFK